MKAVQTALKRIRIMQPTINPKGVVSPFDFQWGVFTHVSIKNFTVIANSSNDIISPFVG